MLIDAPFPPQLNPSAGVALRLQSGDTSADRKTLEVTIPAGGADAEGKTVSAWIDLDGNGIFDEGERATGMVKGGFAELTWQTPDGFKSQPPRRVRRSFACASPKSP